MEWDFKILKIFCKSEVREVFHFLRKTAKKIISLNWQLHRFPISAPHLWICPHATLYPWKKHQLKQEFEVPNAMYERLEILERRECPRNHSTRKPWTLYSLLKSLNSAKGLVPYRRLYTNLDFAAEEGRNSAGYHELRFLQNIIKCSQFSCQIPTFIKYPFEKRLQ